MDGRCYTTCSHLAAASYLLTLYNFHSKMKCFCHGFDNDKHSLPAFTSCPDMESSLLIQFGQTCQTSDWELFTIPLSFFLSLRPSPVQYIEQIIIIRSVMFIPLLQGLMHIQLDHRSFHHLGGLYSGIQGSHWQCLCFRNV